MNLDYLINLVDSVKDMDKESLSGFSEEEMVYNLLENYREMDWEELREIGGEDLVDLVSWFNKENEFEIMDKIKEEM